MLRSRIHSGNLKIHRSLRSTRRKSTLEELTQQSRVKPPGPNPPTTYKSGITKFSRILQWTLVPGELSIRCWGRRSLNQTQGVFGYMALYGDFGENEHVFSPVSLSGCVCRIVLTWGDIAEEVQGRIFAAFTGGEEDCSERDFA